MMEIIIVFIILVFVIVCLHSSMDKYRDQCHASEKRIRNLKLELDDLKEKHPRCHDCHGEGLEIVGRDINDCGVIWKQGGECKKCKGKGTL